MIEEVPIKSKWTGLPTGVSRQGHPMSHLGMCHRLLVLWLDENECYK